ncbi:MAG: 2-oxoglutarate dehydrogenase E1 component [Pseudomonadota bacterium]
MTTQKDFEDSTYLASGGIDFLTQLYRSYLQDPTSIDPSWRHVFEHFDDQLLDLDQDMTRASWAVPYVEEVDDWSQALLSVAQRAQAVPLAGPLAKHDATRDSIRALMLIRNYRVRGHLNAALDPLGFESRVEHPRLDPASYGFTPDDYDRPIFIDGVLGHKTATLRQILAILHRTYSSSIGIEYMHIQDPEQKSWIQMQIENEWANFSLSPDAQKKLLLGLTKAETFEMFLHTKYPGAVRFGLEGLEPLIPALQQILQTGARLGVAEVVLGMAHRGRLNVLANIMDKPCHEIFSEFEGGVFSFEDVQSSGDVKYHLGCSSVRDFSGTSMNLSLTANPSHLEAVNPVVIGKVRAKQEQCDDNTHSKVIGLLLHGDAAFAGQGLVAETLSLSELPGYQVGGTIHIVTNNQIGFTTSPKHSRSSPYSSDVAKMIQTPILHVNGDDLEAVLFVAQLAMQFRQRFNKDIVVDLFGYRRFGHNEMDEPAFTQPLMYQAIAKHSTSRQIYSQKLIDAGVVTADEVEQLNQNCLQELEADFKTTANYKPKKADWLDGVWSGFATSLAKAKSPATGVTIKKLREIGKVLTKVPEGFAIHPRLARVLKEKQQRLEAGKGIDWATAEALAFGALLFDGSPVRLSGQDSRRGTFSQRHSAFIDQNTEQDYIPLNHIKVGQGLFEPVDSSLSEASVLGFEYGFSLADPKALVMWEAQFGDFANGAQVIIDQFICSGESKWKRMSGLVMLLPHGYEGQGPEHSSARFERYLQLCAQDNWQVANITTPANYFHILRRQVVRNIRKPLVIMTPKSLLRHKQAVSSMEDMGPHTRFVPVLADTEVSKKARRLVLCSGKVYYDLLQRRQEQKVTDVALVRIEQLYPFPESELVNIFKTYDAKTEMVWCQEEPENMGAWRYLDRRLESALTKARFKQTRPIYKGRSELASTASGYAKRHAKEQQELVEDVVGYRA